MNQRPLKIGIVCYPSMGGSGIVATELGIQLAELGHEIHFISTTQPFRLHHITKNIHFHQVHVDSYPVLKSPPYALNLAVKIVDIIRSRSLDILHVHYAIPHAVSAFLAREIIGPGSIRYVTTLHGTDITLVGSRPTFFEVTKFAIEQSDAVTTVSEFLRTRTIDTFNLSKEISVIPNFVDPRRFKPLGVPGRRNIFAAPDEKIVLHASNFRPVKRIDTVMKVVASVAGSIPLRLVLMGDGPEIPLAEKLALELGIQDRVIFLGGNESVDEIFPVADIFLLPSNHEGFGLAALEAMSCGVPVIGTSVGGMGEFIEGGENGFLFDPEDVDGMVRTARDLLRDDALRLSVGRNARCTAKESFNIEKIVMQYIEVYRSLA